MWGCLHGFLESGGGAHLPVFCLLDNEEVGSATPEGAASTLLRDVLRRIAADCAARGVRVVLYTPPTWPTYHEHLSEEIVALTRQIGTSLAREFPNVRYADLLKDKRFTADDFFDASHLNYDRGGPKLVRILDDEIAEDPLPAK